MNISRRQYLAEDVAQIQRYFPGARPVSLRTPFDLTPSRQRVIADAFRAEQTESPRAGVFKWIA
ncbi:MAG: hypothetical protein WAQ24_01875 [Candidatus Saccharimonadales bacterium]